jgi:hypothetical protein
VNVKSIALVYCPYWWRWQVRRQHPRVTLESGQVIRRMMPKRQAPKKMDAMELYANSGRDHILVKRN